MRGRIRGWLLHLLFHFLYSCFASSYLFLSDRLRHLKSSGICDLLCYSSKGCISLLFVPRTVYQFFHPGLNILSHLKAVLQIMLVLIQISKEIWCVGLLNCWALHWSPPGCFILCFSLWLHAVKKQNQLNLPVTQSENVETDGRYKSTGKTTIIYIVNAWRKVYLFICITANDSFLLKRWWNKNSLILIIVSLSYFFFQTQHTYAFLLATSTITSRSLHRPPMRSMWMRTLMWALPFSQSAPTTGTKVGGTDKGFCMYLCISEFWDM